MAEDETLVVENLNAVIRALRKSDKEVAKGVRAKLKQMVDLVRDRAKEMAAVEGFTPPGRSGRGTGKLIRSIKSSVRGGEGFIRETAVNKDGFKYPSVYEYGHSRKWGHRPFMEPARDEMAPVVEREFEHLLDEIADSFGDE